MARRKRGDVVDGAHIRPWCSQIAIFCLLFLIGLGVATETCIADYGGSLEEYRCTNQIDLGDSLTVDVTVLNTGTENWYSFSYPSWFWDIKNTSWAPGWSTRRLYYDTVYTNETRDGTTTLDPDDLPTTLGDYSFDIWCYRPTAVNSSSFYAMDNCPGTVNFSVVPEPTALLLLFLGTLTILIFRQQKA